MRRTLVFLIAAFWVVTASAQKTINDPNAVKRQVTGFHGIEVATGIELTLIKGETEEVAVSAARPEYRDKIVTEVVGGILKIHYETKKNAINKIKETKDLKAYVSYKTLDKLVATTGAKVEVSGTLSASDLTMEATTGASINAKVDINKLTFQQSTGAKTTLTGNASGLEVGCSTGSKFWGDNLAVDQCKVNVSTGAKVWINARETITAEASTGGSVYYKGEAQKLIERKSTGGRISKTK